jgi:hypothetical protein
MKKFKLLLLDANVVIQAFKLGLWSRALPDFLNKVFKKSGVGILIGSPLSQIQAATHSVSVPARRWFR